MDGVLNFLAAAAAVHRLQHGVVAMLDGQVQVRHHLGVADQRSDKFIGDTFRIGIQHADPADAVDGLQLVQQLANRARLAPILAISGGVLGDQNQLLDAFPCQPAGLGHAILNFTAAQRAADKRDGAIVAAVVAALGNF